MGKSKKPILLNLGLLAYTVVCGAALVWPGYHWLGNRIEPFVLGIPFSFAWVIAWVLGTFFVMLVYHLAIQRRERDS